MSGSWVEGRRGVRDGGEVRPGQQQDLAWLEGHRLAAVQDNTAARRSDLEPKDHAESRFGSVEGLNGNVDLRRRGYCFGGVDMPISTLCSASLGLREFGSGGNVEVAQQQRSGDLHADLHPRADNGRRDRQLPPRTACGAAMLLSHPWLDPPHPGPQVGSKALDEERGSHKTPKAARARAKGRGESAYLAPYPRVAVPDRAHPVPAAYKVRGDVLGDCVVTALAPEVDAARVVRGADQQRQVVVGGKAGGAGDVQAVPQEGAPGTAARQCLPVEEGAARGRKAELGGDGAGEDHQGQRRNTREGS